jgi:predicted ATPase
MTFFVGENGSGKSTLIEAIAIRAGFNAEGRTKNFRRGRRRSRGCLSSRGSQRRPAPYPRCAGEPAV